MGGLGSDLTGQSDRRRPRDILWLLVGVVCGCLLMLVILTSAGSIGHATGSATSDPKGNASSSASPTGPSGTTATPAATQSSTGGAPQYTPQQVMMWHVPPSFAATCAYGDAFDAKAWSIASVICHPQGAPVTSVQYSWFHDGEAVRQRFAADEKVAGVSAKDPVSVCQMGIGKGAGTFWMAKTTNQTGNEPHHVSNSSQRPTGSTRGALLCSWKDTTATLEWYDSDTRIFGWAQTNENEAAQMFGWWVGLAGPYHPPMGAMMVMAGGASPRQAQHHHRRHHQGHHRTTR